ncbi:MAG: hypothetical protein PVF74_10790 [Anaerolineales bacterium]|jgi:DNA-binding response OmpR family regulator
MATKILWIEGRRKLTPSFVPGLREKGYLVETARTGKTALELTSRLGPDLAVVNAASLRTSGVRICQSMTAGLSLKLMKPIKYWCCLLPYGNS